jgi:hypothetical protein
MFKAPSYRRRLQPSKKNIQHFKLSFIYKKNSKAISKSDYNLKSECTQKYLWNWKKPWKPSLLGKKPKKTKQNKKPTGPVFFFKPGFFQPWGTPLNPDPIRIHNTFNRGDERKGHLITWRELLLLFSSEKEQIWHTSLARCQWGRNEIQNFKTSDSAPSYRT